jgi:hypothetical protein
MNLLTNVLLRILGFHLVFFTPINMFACIHFLGLTLRKINENRFLNIGRYENFHINQCASP